MALHQVNKWLQETPTNGITLSALLAEAGLTETRVIDAIFVVLDDRKHHDELIEAICQHLFTYYRTKQQEYCRFVLFFLPQLIGLHLTTCNNPDDRRKYYCVEVLLLGVYNLEVADEDGQVITRTFRLPTLTKPSIYHEPSQLSSAHQTSSLLTEHALSKLENGSGDVTIAAFGPYNEAEHILANNRMDILSVLLKIYNENISFVPKQSLNSVCRLCFRILRQGKTSNKYSTRNISNFCEAPVISSIIPLSANFLVELVNSVYFCMYNDVADSGLQALEEIHDRAVYCLFTNVILMTNAIKNSLRINPSGQLSDGAMGINVALSPTSTGSLDGLAKTAITNASFKTRKLPDDIPIVPSTGTTPLTAVNEENEEIPNEKPKEKGGAIKAGIGKLLKERKEKKKDLNKTDILKDKPKRTENGDFISNKIMQDEFGSDTSGVSEGKYTDDGIPMNVINTPKTFDEESRNNSSSSLSSDAASVPLVTSESVHNSIIKHNNNETSVNVL